MNRDESIELWKKGKDAWNKWANALLAEKKAMQEAGEWEAEIDKAGQITGKNEDTEKWLERAKIDLSRCIFTFDESCEKQKNECPVKTILGLRHNMDFSEIDFPCSNVYFTNSVFKEGFGGFDNKEFGYARFSGAIFNDCASFDSAIFIGDANFCNTKIFHASFRNTHFQADTTFANDKSKPKSKNTVFSNDADFTYSRFDGPVSFENVTFKKAANFSSIISKRSFSLTDARFKQVPDFTEAAFHEPPVLDDIELGKALTEKQCSIFRKARSPDDTKKYRKLSKMAAEAKDYQNEMKFFADEQRCRRFWHDTPIPFRDGSGRFWFGLVYDKLSNYGRSFLRPLAGWSLLTFIIFPYLYCHFAVTTCANNSWSPLFLSIRHGLIISGLTRTGQLKHHLECLYGQIDNIEWQVSALMMAQPLVSAIFLFLFLLAIRNQFKIR